MFYPFNHLSTHRVLNSKRPPLLEVFNSPLVTALRIFEIDNDVSSISYKFNKRYKDENKYKMNIRNIMTKPMRMKSNPNIAVPPEDIFDIVINCSCEHMFPMWKFREMNERFHGRPLYVLQSSNATQHEDHINCVESVDELIEQAQIKDVLFSGSKVLPNDSTRFMVIGK